jgi:5S rRNA maturation endonuclease (ribonuclease M5)
MTITMNKKFRSPDQHKLKIICDDLCDNIEVLLNGFGIEYKTNHKMITMSCPIHGGDNTSAINIYPQGDQYRGNWKCRTHNCEKEFKGSIIGFVRGVISHQKYGWSEPGDRTCSFKEALDYIMCFLNKDLKDIKISNVDKDKISFNSMVKHFKQTEKDDVPKITRKQIISSLKIPSEYYSQRGYCVETLEKYDIGLCDNPQKPMYNHAVVPIYDMDYKYMVGCSGRSIFNKCDLCKCYHNPNNDCPSKENSWKYSKWKHSAGFKAQNHLYNFWFAKEHILKSSTAIIVESPGNVWRLEENNIHNSVAIFGSSLSDRQKILLDSSGAMNLVILTDNDDAGRKAAEQIKNKCQNTYRIFIPDISRNDVGEMTSEEIEKEIKQYIKRII